jgi:hypothetical protein
VNGMPPLTSIGWSVFVVCMLIAGGLLITRLARDRNRQRALVAATPDWLTLDSEVIAGLAHAGWLPEHLQAIQHIKRAKPDIDPLAVRYFLFMAPMGFPPGVLPEHQLAWTAYLSNTDDSAWLIERSNQLAGPETWNGQPTKNDIGKATIWHQTLGSALAPLAAAAGLTFWEANALSAQGGLHEDRLRALAGLRGQWVPEYR